MIDTIIDIWGHLNIIMVILLTLFALQPTEFMNVVDYLYRGYVFIHTQLVTLWQKMTKG